jgi:hypothetical protein
MVGVFSLQAKAVGDEALPDYSRAMIGMRHDKIILIANMWAHRNSVFKHWALQASACQYDL